MLIEHYQHHHSIVSIVSIISIISINTLNNIKFSLKSCTSLLSGFIGCKGYTGLKQTNKNLSQGEKALAGVWSAGWEGGDHGGGCDFFRGNK